MPLSADRTRVVPAEERTMSEITVNISGAAYQMLARAALRRGVDIREALVDALNFYDWATEQTSAGHQIAVVDGQVIHTVTWQRPRENTARGTRHEHDPNTCMYPTCPICVEEFGG